MDTAQLRDGAVTGAKVEDGSLLARDFLFVTQVFNTRGLNRVLFRVCNATAKVLDPPLGAWAYVVWH